MLTPSEMGAWLNDHLADGDDYFRLETLDSYGSLAEDAEFRAWRTGESLPDNPARTDWIAHIRRHTTAVAVGGHGQRWRKVHVVSGPLSLYEQFAIEFGLALNTAAGEQNRVLEVSDRAHLVHNVGDFYMINRKLVLALNYDDTGKLHGADVIQGRAAGALVAVADLAWEQATPIDQWRREHPEYRTAVSAA
ncbi:MAG: hypothetical protein H0X35_03415 [Pseudonocardiales bacterium]|nr:hypothetical protein [Pseudonocardiales bacterium]